MTRKMIVCIITTMTVIKWVVSYQILCV